MHQFIRRQFGEGMREQRARGTNGQIISRHIFYEAHLRAFLARNASVRKRNQRRFAAKSVYSEGVLNCGFECFAKICIRLRVLNLIRRAGY